MEPDGKLEDLLDQWEESVEIGSEIELEELCKDVPELLIPLREKITALKRMDQCFQSHEQPAPAVTRKKSNISEVVFDAKLVDLQYHDRGGLGVVYKAQDEELHRQVAIKFLNERVALNKEERRRFLQEAEITGRLDHPGVVPVYANGMTDKEQPFYVMRFIQGDTYDDAIKAFHQCKSEMTESELRVARQKLLVQLVSVCNTIGYAHTRGIVHRDIKPKNIMLGKYGETLVVDWGIAIPFRREGQFRVKDEQTLVPQTTEETNSGREGEGTPVFMSPEQAAGRDDLGPASDIYSLGTVLYRVLTGKFAFDGNSAVEIKTAIMKGDFVPPRKIDKSIPTTLQAICLKAMMLDKSQRYETASALAEDLENYLADAPVGAYTYTVLEKMAIAVRQNLTLFSTLFAAAVVLSAVMMFASGKLLRMQNRSQRLLLSAVESQGERLNTTCLMTAKSIQYNLEARLIAMEELAGSREFVDLVQVPGNENQSKLIDLLNDRRNKLQSRLPTHSWFVLNSKGQLLGRVDDAANALDVANGVHWTRPYFHGNEDSMLPISDPKSIPKPVQQPALSPVYFSDTDNRQLCSLSVPVFSDSKKIVGVLVMEMQMGQFDPLIESETDMQRQRFAALVETRGELKGTLLHHPGIKNQAPSNPKNIQVCESMYDSLSEIDLLESEPRSILNYVDPIGDNYAGQWLSVALPIQIRSRNNQRVKCGWYLMVQDRPIAME